MQFKHAMSVVVYTVVFSLSVAHASGTVYRVEPKAKGNTVTLEVKNKLSEELDDLSVEVRETPSWVKINSVTVETNRLQVDSTSCVSVIFEILPAVKAGAQDNLSIVLLSGGFPIARKTIRLMVAIPKTYELDQNYPNPFNPSTTFAFDIPRSSFVTLKIYDLLGREIKALVNEVKEPGKYKVNWDAASVTSGVYFCRLVSGAFVETRKMLLLK